MDAFLDKYGLARCTDHCLQIFEQDNLQNCQKRFYKAFSTSDRAEGKCRLMIIWKKGRKRLEIHDYQLYFDCRGIKECNVIELYRNSKEEWKRFLPVNALQISLLEAVIFIQDAYQQNIRFNSAVPDSFQPNRFLFKLDIKGIDRKPVLNKFFPRSLSIVGFANIYMAALRRLDCQLMYDLLTYDSQQKIGDKRDYFYEKLKKYEKCNFIASGVDKIQNKEKQLSLVTYVILLTPEDEVYKITYNMKLCREEGFFQVVAFTEVTKEPINGGHPENPFNYNVFCSMYNHNQQNIIQKCLEANPDIILTGETEGVLRYKYLINMEKAWEEFKITDSIIAEFILTEKKLLVYSQKTRNLLKIEKFFAENLGHQLSVPKKHYLSVGDLCVSVLLTGKDDTNTPWDNLLSKKQAVSAIIKAEEKELLLSYLNNHAVYKEYLGKNTFYYFIKEKRNNSNMREKNNYMAEFYVTNNWAKINIYLGSKMQELQTLMSKDTGISIINEAELDNSSLAPTVSEQRKWQIYNMMHLLHKEAGTLQKLNIVPTLKDVATKMGAIAVGRF